MAPDQRGEVGDVVIADINAVQPDLADSLLHVDGIPMHDGIEGEPQAAQLLFLPLLKRTPDFATLTVMDTPAETMAQFGMCRRLQSSRLVLANIAESCSD